MPTLRKIDMPKIVCQRLTECSDQSTLVHFVIVETSYSMECVGSPVLMVPLLTSCQSYIYTELLVYMNRMPGQSDAASQPDLKKVHRFHVFGITRYHCSAINNTLRLRIYCFYSFINNVALTPRTGKVSFL